MRTKAIILALFAAATVSASRTGPLRPRQSSSASAAADFGSCTPTMDFQLGRAGRKADEGTFLPTDPVVAQGQQDALNPSIIMNRICDQLTNVCDANDAAVTACEDAQASTEALGTKDASTADAFNSALGF
ncbi:Uu.00g037280.m01.CDS01 [Anthostomella pinea]|uniref:Uu.00g037280.m01.CDS01 n=1 Tax=Anthostomella pinea TaxID=933095 RepID=A0AAI8VAK7_9PEZI|nr:Uu.00g037280.m01.CDS01 [Anthostomella pinea]